MADLFLDNDFTGTDMERCQVARLAESPYSIDQLDAIYAWEVAPAFAFNRRSIAGEWAMWHSDEIRSRVLAVLALPRWRRRLKRLGMPASWPRLRRLVVRQRAAA